MALVGAGILAVVSGRGGSGTGGDFALKSADGPFTLESLRGKVVVVYFGYSFCPDVCPAGLTSIGAALGQLTSLERARAAGVFVSVDPERDSLPHLKQYAAFFHPNMIGVTGTPAEVAKVARQYGVFFSRQAANEGGQYSVDHTADIYLVAPDGRLVERLPHGTAPQTIAAAIRRWLP